VRIVPAKITHVGPLATKMREADRIECKALGRTPKEALRLGLRMSLYSLSAIEDDGAVTAMFGLTVVSALSGVARPWFLGTDRVFMHPRELLCIGKRVLTWWKDEFPCLENIVAVNNHAAIRLLCKWGFEVGGAVEIHRGIEFVPFRAIQAISVTA
jgi:hypothetical protein